MKEKSIDFYWRVRKEFTFSGDHLRGDKDEILTIPNNLKGIDGFKAFKRYDSEGILPPTRHPNIVYALLKTKASVNFHIKLYATDRAKGFLCRLELQEEVYDAFNPPQWFKDAIENQYRKFLLEFNPTGRLV